jgi:hypothetical protein
LDRLQQFRTFYEADLRPVLEEMDARRRRICKTFLLSAAAVAILGAGVCVAVGGARDVLPLGFYVALAAAALVWFVWRLLTRQFVLDFKQRVISAVVRFVDPQLVYSPTDHVTLSRFAESGLFLQRVDRFRGEDLVRGRVDRTELEFSELHAEHRTVTHDSRGRRRERWETIFRGVFFVADFHKHFHGETVVLPDRAQRLLGFLGQKLQALNPARGELVKLEDPEFERQFVVYGSDQVEARYLLSTSLMQRMLEFRTKSGQPVYFAFAHSNIYVAISSARDRFEPSLFSTLASFDRVRQFLADLEFVLGIVEDLNLNTRIWSKA